MPTPARSRDPRYFDFDEAFADGDSIPFKLMGKVWELPGDVPAETILRIQRLMLLVGKLETGGEVPEDMVIDDDLSYEKMVRDMAGDAIVDEWLTYEWTTPKGVKRTGPGYQMLQAVSRRLFAIHTGSPVEDETPGKAKRPADRKPPARKRPAARSSARKR